MATTSLCAEVVRCGSRAEWIENRREFVGASESASILGVGYAETGPHTVWHDKVYGGDDPEVSKRLTIGRMIEPTLRDIFTMETGLACSPAGSEWTIHRHPELPYMGATLDALTVDPDVGCVPVELKNVDSFNRHDWDGDELPLKFHVQVQHQMAVVGAPRAYLFGLIGGNTPIVKRVDRNDAFISVLIGRLAQFWDYVQRKEVPPVDDSIAAAKVLAKLYPHGSGETVQLSAELAEAHEELENAKARIKELDAKKRHAQNMLTAAIGEATFGEIPGVEGFYSWKEQARVVRCPACNAVTSESHFRVLRKVKRNR